MIRLTSILAMAALCVACSDSAPESSAPEEGALEIAMPEKITDGRLVVSALEKVSEPNACILPLTISNGTVKPATISMMQFEVSGPGESDSGNMFGQKVEPGMTNTARILFPARQCTDLLEITPANLKCETNGLDCADAVEFESLPSLTFTEVSSN